MLEIYKCEECVNIVEVVHASAGMLVCCVNPMKLFKENTVGASIEKHVSIIEKTADGYRIKVGGVVHPMEEKYYIEWIELIIDRVAHRKFLNLGEAPDALFCIDAQKLPAREYCNLLGLWKA